MEHPIGGIPLIQSVSLNKVKKTDFIPSTFKGYREIIQTLKVEEKLENSQICGNWTAHSPTILPEEIKKKENILRQTKTCELQQKWWQQGSLY